jgi:hypothetical protein
MLIKTTKDDTNHQYFIGFSSDDDTQKDQAITEMFYKTWALNTGNKMLDIMFKNKLKINDLVAK